MADTNDEDRLCFWVKATVTKLVRFKVGDLRQVPKPMTLPDDETGVFAVTVKQKLFCNQI
jgi:hypothetical protein